jgi:hypothetical protein
MNYYPAYYSAFRIDFSRNSEETPPMMIVLITKNTLTEWRKFMSEYGDKFLAALEKVAAGGPGDPSIKADIAKLLEAQTALIERANNNDLTDAEQKAAILELQETNLAFVNKLAVSTPPTT